MQTTLKWSVRYLLDIRYLWMSVGVLGMEYKSLCFSYTCNIFKQPIYRVKCILSVVFSNANQATDVPQKIPQLSPEEMKQFLPTQCKSICFGLVFIFIPFCLWLCHSPLKQIGKICAALSFTFFIIQLVHLLDFLICRFFLPSFLYPKIRKKRISHSTNFFIYFGSCIVVSLDTHFPNSHLKCVLECHKMMSEKQ